MSRKGERVLAREAVLLPHVRVVREAVLGVRGDPSGIECPVPMPPEAAVVGGVRGRQVAVPGVAMVVGGAVR